VALSTILLACPYSLIKILVRKENYLPAKHGIGADQLVPINLCFAKGVSNEHTTRPPSFPGNSEYILNPHHFIEWASFGHGEVSALGFSPVG
jgi:hypothetical protein